MGDWAFRPFGSVANRAEGLKPLRRFHRMPVPALKGLANEKTTLDARTLVDNPSDELP